MSMAVIFKNSRSGKLWAKKFKSVASSARAIKGVTNLSHNSFVDRDNMDDHHFSLLKKEIKRRNSN